MSEFHALTTALEGSFDRTFADLPDGLRERVQQEFFPLTWSMLSNDQRRRLALLRDSQNDPAYEQERQAAWDLYLESSRLKGQIAEWEAVATPTAIDKTTQEKRLNELRHELAKVESEQKVVLSPRSKEVVAPLPVTTRLALRDGLFARLSRGDLDPEAAEQEAKALGCGPLNPTPDTTRFDPMRKTHWSMAMAIVWIMSRNADEVMECDNDYLGETRIWMFREYRLPVDGGNSWREQRGWMLEQPHPIATNSLELRTDLEKCPPATAELWIKLQNGDLTAEGLRASDGSIVDIPSREWVHLEACEDRNGREYFCYRHNTFGRAYDSVLLRRADIERHWPAPRRVSRIESTMASRIQCQKWLQEMMAASRERKPKAQSEYQKEAQARWGDSLSERSFKAAWRDAAQAENALAWVQPGRTAGSKNRPIKNPRTKNPRTN